MEIVNVSEAGGVGTSLGQMERGVVLAWGANSGPGTSNPSWPEEVGPFLQQAQPLHGHCLNRSDWTLSSGASSSIWFRVNASAAGVTFVHVPMEAWAQDTMASQPLLGLSYSSRCDVTCQLRSCTFFPPLCKIRLSVNWKPPEGYVRDSDWFWEGL